LGWGLDHWAPALVEVEHTAVRPVQVIRGPEGQHLLYKLPYCVVRWREGNHELLALVAVPVLVGTEWESVIYIVAIVALYIFGQEQNTCMHDERKQLLHLLQEQAENLRGVPSLGQPASPARSPR